MDTGRFHVLNPTWVALFGRTVIMLLQSSPPALLGNTEPVLLSSMILVCHWKVFTDSVGSSMLLQLPVGHANIYDWTCVCWKSWHSTIKLSYSIKAAYWITMTHDLFFFWSWVFWGKILLHTKIDYSIQRVMSCVSIHPIKTVFSFRTVMPILYTSNSVPLLPHIEMHVLAWIGWEHSEVFH